MKLHWHFWLVWQKRPIKDIGFNCDKTLSFYSLLSIPITDEKAVTANCKKGAASPKCQLPFIAYVLQLLYSTHITTEHVSLCTTTVIYTHKQQWVTKPDGGRMVLSLAPACPILVKHVKSNGSNPLKGVQVSVNINKPCCHVTLGHTGSNQSQSNQEKTQEVLGFSLSSKLLSQDFT